MATVRTTAAGFNAIPHVTDPFAIIRALSADLRAFTTNVAMMFRAYQHEMRRGPADLRAGHHQLEMLRLDMFTAGFQAMVHRRGQACAVTAQAIVDTLLYLAIRMHRYLPWFGNCVLA